MTRFYSKMGAVDMTPWRHARLAGYVLVAIALAIYVTFADFSVLAVVTGE